MGRDNHNAALHYIRHTHKEDLSYYDLKVQEQREKAKRAALEQEIKQKSTGEIKTEQEALIRNRESRGIFTPERLEQVQKNRRDYFTAKPSADEVFPDIFNSIVGKKPGTKQLVDASITKRLGNAVLQNMLLFAWQKKKNLYLILDAIDAIFYDDAILNVKHKEIDKPFPPFGDIVSAVTLLAEALECEPWELFKDPDECCLKDFAYAAVKKLKDRASEVEYDDGYGYWTAVHFEFFDYFIGMSKYVTGDFGFYPTLTIEKEMLTDRNYLYSVSYTMGFTHSKSELKFRRAAYIYEETTGLVQEIADEIILKDKKANLLAGSK